MSHAAHRTCTAAQAQQAGEVGLCKHLVQAEGPTCILSFVCTAVMPHAGPVLQQGWQRPLTKCTPDGLYLDRVLALSICICRMRGRPCCPACAQDEMCEAGRQCLLQRMPWKPHSSALCCRADRPSTSGPPLQTGVLVRLQLTPWPSWTEWRTGRAATEGALS